ncbi:efflux RND transporter periplasmic adaptor subunit [Altererythrobacter sp. CC-YST694]|uniref:efflux RND transporter periplasmic adaptor subunit n=1 Tax=Altererythrobacter sp. CC-YST694 TaxID=2755038 RepID=UPI001D00DEE5|nr:efflux RND transporter periplasmic adaptor subunit [Altererythrobacter sp. CC-YST694]MCB5426441.1 efflux RND transporter periplasmic adaptor subunit [Altererythrobacter sp. CC-YST694]
MNELTSIELQDGRSEPLIATSRKGRKRALGIVGIVAALAGAWYLLGAAGDAPPPPPPAAVTVSAPLQRQITEWDEFVGRFEASRAVEIRPRVSGAVTAVHFKDGQIVRKGQPLFTIDPRPFTAALREAQADVSAASSDLALARSDLERASRLVEFDGVSKSEIDRLRARERAAAATLAAAQARVNSRALDVEFSTVRAPMTGRVSDRRVDPGNLVSAGDGGSGTLLTTLMAVDPIYFSFEGSEALFLKARRNGAGEGLPVAVRLQDESDYVHQGRLDFTDNSLDPRSGTIRARAVFDNPDLFLTPGMFGNMHLATGGKVNALLVPDTAVQTDQARKLLLVVKQDGTVAAKPVQLGPVIDGLRVIRSGLQPTDRVVIVGTQFAAPGSKVEIRKGTIAPIKAEPKPAIAAPLSGKATFVN